MNTARCTLAACALFFVDVAHAIVIVRHEEIAHGRSMALVDRAKGAFGHARLKGQDARRAFHLHSVRSKTKEASRGPGHNPGWFGSTDQYESTFDVDSVDADAQQSSARKVEFGWDPAQGFSKAFTGINSMPQAWFAETESGGPSDAWQTFYPPVPGGTLKGSRTSGEPWRETPEGWKQDYHVVRPSEQRAPISGRPAAEWFDSSVAQYDGYGRWKLPGSDSMRRYPASEGWYERAVNTTITCADPGCEASAILQLYDNTTEEVVRCHLSTHVHPTDYDNDEAEEVVEYWKVNGRIASTNCNPNAQGCNNSAWTRLYPCLDNFDISDLVGLSGKVLIQGKISQFVDECPYDGYLLNGVVVATCVVRTAPPTTGQTPYGFTTTPPSPADIARTVEQALMQALVNGTVNVTTLMNLLAQNGLNTTDILGPGPGSLISISNNGPNGSQLLVVQTAKTTVQCDQPGCTASNIMYPNVLQQLLSTSGGACALDMSIYQTDYDNSLNQVEQVEFVAIEEEKIATALQPGLNPCNEANSGHPLSESQMLFNVVSGYDITARVKYTKSFRVTAKNSEFVDDCAYNGSLFYGLSNVICTIPVAGFATALANATAQQNTAVAAAAVANTTGLPFGLTTNAVATTTTVLSP